MSKFPHKTPNELRRYFSQLSLGQLLEINRSYGPHFESLDAQDEGYKKNIKELNPRLAYFTEKYEAHLQTYEDVEIREATYQSNRNAMLSEMDQTDRLLGFKTLGISPMEIYEYEARCLRGEISKTSDEIKRLNACIATVEQKTRGAVSELRILNSVIDLKRELTPEVASNQLGMSY
ncbi:hypothetical protein ACTAZI_15525 [Legionella bozemanae]|uniref:hypothetical protein n=1 Tax=Legionella bozemanae TaxID=447 RepID=UPI003EE987DB